MTPLDTAEVSVGMQDQLRHGADTNTCSEGASLFPHNIESQSRYVYMASTSVRCTHQASSEKIIRYLELFGSEELEWYDPSAQDDDEIPKVIEKGS